MKNASEHQNITQSKIKQILIKGNIFDNQKKQQLLNIISQIDHGNKSLYHKFVNVILHLLLKRQTTISKQIKQIMYDHITQLAITANPQLIHDLNNDLFVRFSTEIYKPQDNLQQYIALWKYMYNGQKDKQDFPNINKTLQKIITQKSTKLSPKLSKFYNEFNKNLEKHKEKKVEFFEDFQDSSFSQSIEDQSRITQIVYMDIMEIKAIRQKIQTQSLSQQNCGEYLIKMKTFLNLKPKSLNNQLLIEFNKEKVWARHFIDHHAEYLKKVQNVNNSNNQILASFNKKEVNKTTQVMISLSKDEESIEQPPKGFYKNKQKTNIYSTNARQLQSQNNQHNYIANTRFKTQNSDEDNLPNIKKSKLQSQIKNFTINQVPLDESHFTQRSSKVLPVFNNSIQKGTFNNTNNLGYDHINERSNIYQDRRMVPDQNYKQMSFDPKQKRSKSIKNVPISRPKPEQTLPLDQSTMNNNYSIPQQGFQAYTIKNTPTKVNNTFGYQGNINKANNNQNFNFGFNKILEGSSSNAKENGSSSNNPFANSKTHYFQLNLQNSDNNKNANNMSPYQLYRLAQKQKNSNNKQFGYDTRNRMTQNDLDSQNMDQNIIVKPHYQKSLKYQNNNSKSVQLYGQSDYKNQFKNLGYNQTGQNFNKNNAGQNIYTNFRSQQNIISNPLSPRSHTGLSRSNTKKRLSQVTSEKKMRKTQASKYQVFNGPEQYVYRPYSIHFNRNQQGFNNFKRNCLEDKFTIYASSQLVIQCKLKKINNSKLQIQIQYENQIRKDLQLKIMYKIPKCFKIQKVSKIHRKFVLKFSQKHIFNLNILEFPLQTCLLDLSYYEGDSEDGIENLLIALPITIRNFIEILVSSKEELLSIYEKSNSNNNNGNTYGINTSNSILSNLSNPFKLSKTFQLNRHVIQPSQIDFILSRQFINIGAIQGYSVQQYGSLCSYKMLDNLVFLIRLSIRIDHIITIELLGQNEATDNQKDFMRYYMEMMVTLLGEYRMD